MKKITTITKNAFILLVFFFTVTAHSQLSNFTITVLPSPAACGGTGSLAFTAIGANPLAVVTYSVYLLPNTTTPIAVTTAATVNNLGAGNYSVIATQTLGAASGTSPAVNVTIQSLVIPTVFVAVQTQAICGNDGKITANVTTGNGPYQYELYAGTTTTNPIVSAQSSNVFNNLAPGSYTVRVIDSCGALSNQYIVVMQAPFNITIGGVSVGAGELPSCTTIDVTHNYSVPVGGVISYPLTFKYTVTNPNGGAPTIITQVVTAAGQNSSISQDIPFYHNQQYTYTLQITDACGRIFTRNNNIVNAKFTVTQSDGAANCNDNLLMYTVDRYVAPYTVNFTTFPAGFNPALANPQHPTFTDSDIVYGEDSTSVPDGTYVAVFTDACGHTFTTSPMVVEYPEPDVSIIASAECGATTGFMRAYISIPGRTITEVIITDAPQAYKNSILPQVLPKDVSAFITPIPTTGFLMENLPLGIYTLAITDSCGDTYTEEANIEQEAGELVVSHANRPGCTEGMGSLRISDPVAGPALTSVIIMQTDANLGGVTFPYDVSANIATNGAFYMNSLPEGNYTFSLTGGACNSTATKIIAVTGYHVTTNNVEVIQYCGSFDVNINHVSNGSFSQSNWLQKFNQVTGAWGHPLTGVAYPEGTQPNAQNSVFIPDNNQLYPYSGEFRILKVFFTFSNGNSFNNRCTDVLHTFTIGEGPVIVDVFSLPCVNGTIETAIIATGVAPLTYKIITKNGDPFVIDNGISNIFSGLLEGLYELEVTDNCANKIPYTLNLNNVEPIAITSEGFCENEPSRLYVQDYPFLTYAWYRQDAPTIILSTDNSLEFPSFNSATDSGAYILQISSPSGSPCFEQILEPFIIDANDLPDAGQNSPPIAVCNAGVPVDLAAYLSAGHDTGGTWQDVNNTNLLAGSTFSPAGLAAGTYQFIYKVEGVCNLSAEATITIVLNDIPAAPVTTTVAPVCEGSAIQLTATAEPGVIYQWTGPDGFTSSDQNPVLQSASMASNGVYTVSVSTVNGCSSPGVPVTIVVNAVPKITIEGDMQLCEGQSGYLSIEGDNLTAAVTYEWYYDNNLLQGVTTRDIQIFEMGTYRAVAKNGLCESLPFSIDVARNDTAFEVLLAAGCENDRYIVSVTNLTDLPDAVFLWTGPEGFTATGPEIDITDMAKGDYVVTVTNVQGCTVNAAITITGTSCRIPKGISPNNDGDNDSFDLSELNVKHIMIFNRYGLTVYESNNYKKEWHGQSDKGHLPTGTYYYVITLPNKTVSGWVYLQREM